MTQTNANSKLIAALLDDARKGTFKIGRAHV